jgi:acyl carrier protein
MQATRSSLDDRAARRIIAGQLGVGEELILDHTRFEEIGADALDIVTIGIHLERASGLPPGEAAFERCATVGEMLALLETFIDNRGVGAPLRQESIPCS